MTLLRLFAAGLLTPDLHCPPGLLSRPHCDPAARYNIYRNNVTASLIQALSDTFPVVQQLVGAEFFSAMARVFVQTHPPQTRQLTFYGSELPPFIDQFPPAASVPYVSDVARLELARIRAYHAADACSLTLDQAQSELQAAQELASTSDSPGRLTMQLHPSLAALQSDHAMCSIWRAHQIEPGKESVCSFSTTPAESAWIFRQGLDVYVLPVPKGSAQFVAALGQGLSLVEAAEDSAACGDFDLSQTLGSLLRHGLVTQIESSLPIHPTSHAL